MYNLVKSLNHSVLPLFNLINGNHTFPESSHKNNLSIIKKLEKCSELLRKKGYADKERNLLRYTGALSKREIKS